MNNQVWIKDDWFDNWESRFEPKSQTVYFRFSKKTKEAHSINIINYLKSSLSIKKDYVPQAYTILFNEINKKTISFGLKKLKLKAQINNGKYEYTIGNLVQFNLKKMVKYDEYYATFTIDVKDNKGKIQTIERSVESFDLIKSGKNKLVTLTKEEKKKLKEMKAPEFITNKFGHEIRKGTLIVLYSSVKKEMIFGRVIKIWPTYFEYKTVNGKTKKCRKADMVYVPQNQEEFENELTLEILKA